ncbi:hypothetical protein [Ammoniphilus resinae]|nr:hypothetical protein [Ammoniphilus resinae]
MMTISTVSKRILVIIDPMMTISTVSKGDFELHRPGGVHSAPFPRGILTSSVEVNERGSH